MKLTKVGTLAAIAALAIGLTACGGSSGGQSTGDAQSNAQQAQDTTTLEAVIPLPAFPFSQIRQDLVDVEAINALGIQSTTFFFVPGIDHPIFSCASTGVPIPSTDQLSNPFQVQWKYNGSDGVASAVTGQEEPEGIYTGDSTGTYSLCNNTAGKQFEGYDEAYTVSFTASAHWDSTLKVIVVDGSEVMPVCKIETKQVTSNGKTTTQGFEVCTNPVANPNAQANIPTNGSTAAYVKVTTKAGAGTAA